MLSKKEDRGHQGLAGKLRRPGRNGTVLPASIVEAVRGGVIALVNGVRVFVPPSLAAERYNFRSPVPGRQQGEA